MNGRAGMAARWGEELAPLLIVAGVALFFALAMWWHLGRSRALLRRWASRHGIRLLVWEYRWFSRGPFAWTTSNGQAVYRITAEFPDGDMKRGWARVGGWLLGLLSDRVDVRWDPHESAFPVVFPAPLEEDEIVRP